MLRLGWWWLCWLVFVNNTLPHVQSLHLQSLPDGSVSVEIKGISAASETSETAVDLRSSHPFTFTSCITHACCYMFM